MEKSVEVVNQLVFFSRIAGLNRVFPSHREKPWIKYLIILSKLTVVYSSIDYVIFSRKYLNRNDVLKLVTNCKYSSEVHLQWSITSNELYLAFRAKFCSQPV